MPTSSLDEDDGLAAISEPLDGEALISALANKALIERILPRLHWRDERGIDTLSRKPSEHRE